MTKKQRNQHYKKAYERIENGSQKYVCIVLDVLTRYRYSSDTLLNVFKEFMLFKPKNAELSESWFGYEDIGREQRLNALAFCIAMTE